MKLSGLKQYGTVRNLIRSCALASVIFFFVPAFSVSCAGHTETVGASHILKGIRYKGSEITPAQPVLLLLLLLPVLIYGAWHIRRLGERTCLLVCMSCSLGEFLGWILLYLRCRDMEDYGFRVTAAPAYFADLLWPAVIFVLSLLIWTGRLSAYDHPAEILRENHRKALPVTKAGPGWKCPSCDRENEEGHAFCAGCGTKRSTLSRCPACGEVLGEGALFCAHCGKDLSEG